MNRKSKTIWTVTIVFFSTLLLALPQAAMARNGRGGRGTIRSAPRGRSMGKRSGGRSYGAFGHSIRGRRGYGGSFFGLSFGFSDNYYSTSSRQWVPGQHQTQTEQVLVEPAHHELQTRQVQVEPERYEVRQIPAVQETRYDEQGKPYQVVIKPAHTETVWIPPKYEQREVKVWVPDRYETRQTQVWVPGQWVYNSAYAPGPSSSIRIGGRIRF